MPWPQVDPLIETFFDPTRIFLFGKPFDSLTYAPGSMNAAGPFREFENYNPPAAGAELPMPPSRLERTLRRATPDGIFARIYSFSFEGHYYTMPRPLLFLVRGPGAVPPRSRRPEGLAPPPGAGPLDQHFVFRTRYTGLEAKDWHFSDDIRVWAVDKKDLAVCLDLEVDNYERILLDSMIAFQEEIASRGAIAGRGAAASRGAAAARGAAASRGAASFRGAMLGPHQEF